MNHMGTTTSSIEGGLKSPPSLQVNLRTVPEQDLCPTFNVGLLSVYFCYLQSAAINVKCKQYSLPDYV